MTDRVKDLLEKEMDTLSRKKAENHKPSPTVDTASPQVRDQVAVRVRPRR